jgi:hypothetical protein
MLTPHYPSNVARRILCRKSARAVRSAGMGNGAMPHGPSYRAHPRLYQLGPAKKSAIRSLSCDKRTKRAARAPMSWDSA